MSINIVWSFDLYAITNIFFFVFSRFLYIERRDRIYTLLVNLYRVEKVKKINAETSDLNPRVMCTSKSKKNWRQINFDQTI
jgi:hypothetical protein